MLTGDKMKTRSNEDWISSLNAKGEAKQKALSDLREIILASLPHALSKWITPIDPRFEPLIQEATQETLLRVMEKLDTFEGRSRFTTWVYTIAVRIALTELRRARWKEVSFDKLREGFNSDDKPREIPDQDVNVEASAEQNETLLMMQKIMGEILTEKQHDALMAVAVHGMPTAEVARRMGTNRNALYKLLHDARSKLKIHLEEKGLSPSSIIATFEK
jgi:RNA polymerase sigma-70 factor (ECF subfamily)